MAEKRKVRFLQADIARAVKGAAAGGMKVGRVEIGPDNSIVIMTAQKEPEPESAFDAWMALENAR